MELLQGTVIRYPWGTTDAIPAITGVPADGEPIAEYWLGAHPLSPSTMAGTTLDRVLAEHPELLGSATREAFGSTLPFLMKILSARHALSIQAHPDRSQAEAGWAREQTAGIALTASERVYKDDWPKPEIMVALTEFHTLVGFRDPRRTVELFDGLGLGTAADRVVGALKHRSGPAALQQAFLGLLTLTGERRDIVDEVLSVAMTRAGDADEVGDLARTALTLDETFTRDPGILAALLMNHVVLQPGEACYVEPGTLHAHMQGTGIEVMARSDNVIRGGLTSKHIAVDELVEVVDFGATHPEVLPGVQAGPGVWDYPTHCSEFDVWRLEADGTGPVPVPADGFPRIALVTRGRATFHCAAASLDVSLGQAVFIPAVDSGIRLSGDAQVFLSGPGISS